MKDISLEEYRQIWERSIKNPEEFWNEIAKELIWFNPYTKVLSYKSPDNYRWFVGGKINIAYNALDRWVKQGMGEKTAIIWLNEEGKEKKYTYLDLYELTAKIAKFIREHASKGDTVLIYMPMVVEAGATMLASARAGTIHTVVFSGFGVKALADRIRSAKPKIIFTADVTFRRGKTIELKSIVDEAIKESQVNVKKVVVLNREGKCDFKEERDVDFNEILKLSPFIEVEKTNSEDPLFILYTSGTTGKPKGIVHAMGSYTVWDYAHVKWLYDFSRNRKLLTTADLGWINGHSYSLYGVLLNYGTAIWIEGVLDYPHPGVMWEIIEKYHVEYVWTAPTLIKVLMKYGEQYINKYDTSSLEIFVTAGESLGLEALNWLRRNVKAKKIFEVWGQTENSGYIASPGGSYYGFLKIKDGSVGLPLPSIEIKVVDDNGNEVPIGRPGNIIITTPSPAFMIGLWNDERYKNYYAKFGYYETGDFGYLDEEGYLYILGRSDDIIKVAGHRIGVAEVENAASISEVAEVAAVGVHDPIRGEVIIIFAVPKEGAKDLDYVKQKIVESVRKNFGAIAIIKDVIFVNKLPHTRTGKIMRRVLRALASGNEVGDISTLEDETSIEEAKKALSEIKVIDKS
ncbi:AMP-binding protein [Sulfurisphaera ohwakuensis]|uniref:AMP-binding protein n=1 Tax=Sulfurisphaera ohwakuensis TaxID=69656 RepID=A0A650CEW9_SULOH|nr:AMP-binding protein [Sulfurisphaera ohwakuensis]MBB5254764.1 acyl-coenzyme A synthetase/AMP-(fatty) acid ligase [Sulfurisphaera ohwakuensis]QGR16401.1 AMP-binding protein [Sulfurisphaera ohwakuensis]